MFDIESDRNLFTEKRALWESVHLGTDFKLFPAFSSGIPAVNDTFFYIWHLFYIWSPTATAWFRGFAGSRR